jgi:hypothetical protein
MKATRRLAEVWRSAARTESGAALVIALLTIVVMMLLTAALVTASMTETFSAQTAEDSARAFLVADAAAARALASLRLDPDWSDGRGAVGGCPDGAVYDLLSGECMRNVAYPKYGSYVASRPGSGNPGPTGEPECAAAPISPPSASPVPLPEQEGFGRYTVTVEGTPEPGKVTLRAVGQVGRATRGFTFTVQRVTPADFVSYSALRVDATRVGNGTFRIHGSVYVRGNWEFHGNSRQLNDRPTSEADSPPYDNQTFVCSDLVLTGNPQIGEPSRPMLAVHIAGDVTGAGRAYEIHALLQDKVVPDIRLGAVDRAIECIRGVPNEACREENGRRVGEFAGLWDSYTNALVGGQMVYLYLCGGTWRQGRATDLSLAPAPRSARDCGPGTPEKWALPKLDRDSVPPRVDGQCVEKVRAGAALRDVLKHCAAYYDAAAAKLYVSGRWIDAAGRVRSGTQVIYVPGSVSVLQDVEYRVEDLDDRLNNDPTEPCDPTLGDSDPCRPNDGALVVAACERGTPCNPNNASPTYGLDVQEMLRAQRWASRGVFYPQTTFPTRDLLAVLVNGKVRFGLSGNPAQQEINLVVLSGCEATLPADRCDLTMQKNLQLYGSVISRLLVFEQNVDLYQVPDLRRYLPFVLDRFLSAPGGAAVVVTSWREIGF